MMIMMTMMMMMMTMMMMMVVVGMRQRERNTMQKFEKSLLTVGIGAYFQFQQLSCHVS